MSSSTFILSHGSVLEWKDSGKTYFNDQVPLGDIIEQFVTREDLPNLSLDIDNTSKINIMGEYQISLSGEDDVIKARTGIPLSEIAELIQDRLPAAMEVMQAQECSFILRAYRDLRDCCICSPPIIILHHLIIPSNHSFEWLVSDIDRITKEELESVIIKMHKAKIPGINGQFEQLFHNFKAIFEELKHDDLLTK